MLNDNDAISLAHSAHNFALLIFAWAIDNAALHLDLLSLWCLVSTLP
jgi:hypothetical protein